jgi:hypothetical protein
VIHLAAGVSGFVAAAAVINTNLATAVALTTWLILDMLGSREKKPGFLGAVSGFGAMVTGLVASLLVWTAMTYLPRHVWPFNRVDDALGVVYTHGFADLHMIVSLGLGNASDISTSGAFYGHPKQLLFQAGAALKVIIWDAMITFLILKGPPPPRFAPRSHGPGRPPVAAASDWLSYATATPPGSRVFRQSPAPADTAARWSRSRRAANPGR